MSTNVEGQSVSPDDTKTMLCQGVRSAAEIRAAADFIYNNRNLSYGYREDVIAVLEWVLNGEQFDGLEQFDMILETPKLMR